MRIQTREYIEFVRTFVDNSSIMTKRFFLVVPYTQAILNKGKGGMSFGKNKGQLRKKVLDLKKTVHKLSKGFLL